MISLKSIKLGLTFPDEFMYGIAKCDKSVKKSCLN